MLDVLASPLLYNSLGPPVCFVKLPAHAIHSDKQCSFYSKCYLPHFTSTSVFCSYSDIAVKVA